MGVALAWAPCSRCGAPCVTTPARWQLALCQNCRPAPAIPPHSVPWRPTLPRILLGELGPVVPHDGRTAKERESAAKLAVERQRYRVLVPARPAQRDELPAAAISMIDMFPGGRATFAMAEDTERGVLMRSVALWLARPVRAVAFWEDGRWSSGHIMGPYFRRCAGADEWIARARGEAWTPPSCPRCGRTGVKTRQDGQTYKHKTIEGEECT